MISIFDRNEKKSWTILICRWQYCLLRFIIIVRFTLYSIRVHLHLYLPLELFEYKMIWAVAWFLSMNMIKKILCMNTHRLYRTKEWWYNIIKLEIIGRATSVDIRAIRSGLFHHHHEYNEYNITVIRNHFC